MPPPLWIPVAIDAGTSVIVALITALQNDPDTDAAEAARLEATKAKLNATNQEVQAYKPRTVP